MTCPSGNSWVTPIEKMPKWVRESSAVSGPEVARDPQHLADLELAVLGQLAEQPHQPVLQVRERAVCRACAPEAVELSERVRRKVDRGQPGHHPGVGELGDLRRQERPRRVRMPVIPAGPRRPVEVMAEPRDVGGFGQVGGGRDEQRPAVLAQRERVHVRAPGRQAGPVRRLLARLLPHALGVLRDVEDAPVGEHLRRAEPEAVNFLRHRARDRQQPIRQPGDQIVVPAQHAHRDPQVRGRLRLHGRRRQPGRGSRTLRRPPRSGP